MRLLRVGTGKQNCDFVTYVNSLCECTEFRLKYAVQCDILDYQCRAITSRNIVNSDQS